jgi:hypothetical protein
MKGLSKFIPAPNFEKDLADEPETKAIFEDRANQALAAAQRIAPRRTGKFAASLYVNGAQVGSDHPAATYIEFGTVSTPVHATLRKAAEQAGGKIVGRFDDV